MEAICATVSFRHEVTALHKPVLQTSVRLEHTMRMYQYTHNYNTRGVATHCLTNAAVALNTRRGGLKAKRNEVDVEQDEDSVQSYQRKEDIQ